MPKGVACTVSNCRFWGENNKCVASEIKIEIDAHANGDNKYEFASEFDDQHKDKARQSVETCCLTFTPKE